MDRDDAVPDRGEEARQGDTGMIGSETEEPGPGRDTSQTQPDPVAAGAEQPQTTVAMSEGDPMATRLGSHVEGAGVIGHDVAAAEEGATRATQATQAEDHPAGLAAEPAVDQQAYARVEDAGPSDSAGYADRPVASEPPAFATDDAGDPDRSAVTDRPGPQEPGVYDQEDDQARRQRPSDVP
jgi:hypothetical protein